MASSVSDDTVKTSTRKLVLIAGPKSHGPTGNGVHDYPWSVKLLKVMLDHSNVREQVRVEYHLDGMPSDLKTLDDADSIMVISDGRDGNLYQEAPHFGSPENLAAVQKQIDRGCGFLTFHFSTFAPDQYAKQIIEWSGGYFDWETDGQRKWYSAITHKEADVELGTPEHAVVRGVKPFKMKEEFYFNLRFANDGAKADGLSPLFVVPALNGREPDGNVVAWAKQRSNGGRGFGTTCGHFYSNWERDEFRKLILNAIAWTAKLDVPKDGVEARYFTHAEITQALAGVEGTQRAVIDDKPIRVLLIAGNDAHKWHNWERTTPAMKAALEKDPRIKVDVSLDIEDLAKKDIGKNYDIILPNYVNWHAPKPLSDASKTTFMNFVQNGGGVLFVHFNSSAFHFSLPMAAESDWPELRKIAIRAWNHHGKDEAKSGHDAFGPFKVDVTPLEHVITAGLKNFDVVDELYFKQDGRPVDPLITAKSKVTGRDEPLAFVGSYGKGKIFQTLLGHSEKTYDAFEPREMLRRAAAWAANRRVLKLRAEDDPVVVADAPKAASAAPAPAPAASALRLTEGKFGQALDTRATGVTVVAKPEQASVPITVECWTKLESKTAFNILVASEPKSSPTHWELYSYVGSGNYSVYLPGCGGEYRSDVNIADGQWHHVAMTLEAIRIRLFVDGKQVVDKPLPSEFAASKGGALAIGRLAEGGIGSAGLIDEVRIRRGAHAFESLPDKAPTNDDNTVGLWRFEEIVEKTKLKDESKSQTMAVAAVAVAQPAPAANAQAAGGKPKPPAHWGKEQIGFDQWEGDWVDNRWKESQIGRWLSSVVGGLPGGAGRKMTSIRVGDQQQATVCFDADHAQVRAIWTGGFLKFNPARFGIIGAPVPDGGFMFQSTEHSGWGASKVKLRGLHAHGERVVLSYLVDGVAVRESPWCEQLGDRLVVTRLIEVEPAASDLQLLLHHKVDNIEMSKNAPISLLRKSGDIGSWIGVRSESNIEPFVTSGDGGFSGGFKIPASKSRHRLKLVYWTGSLKDSAGWEQALAAVSAPKPSIEPELATLLKPGPAKWTAKIETEFVTAPNDAPYVVDTFKLPFDNPYKALLFTSGHDFFSNGDIAVCTVHGDVWRVSQEGENKLRWQRIATGLHQPLGLVVERRNETKPSERQGASRRFDAAPDPRLTPRGSQERDDALYVLCRDQIVRLHDLNDDRETDYYECFSNVYPTSAGGHDYITCLERDSVGNFWFVHANLGIVRVSSDGSKFDVISTGLRNPNGMGLGPGDVVTAAPQEGDWTPASAIFVAKPGAHFGGGGPRITPERPLGFDSPAVWIPRRVDNSSGGQCWVTSDKWGPLSGHMLHFSFGQCSAMLGIGSHARQSVGETQDSPRSGERGYIPTGLVEFPFRFDSGAMRGRFSPLDGQLYVTGLRGWTTSAVTDGCLQRVRFTGKPIDMPVSMQAHSNGIALSFTESLDKDAAENPSSYHVEQWNYSYSKNYGSPEYRMSDPKQEGRDEVRVRSATLIDERTVFLEMKDVKPVNVMAVSCVLKSRLGFHPAPNGASGASSESDSSGKQGRSGDSQAELARKVGTESQPPRQFRHTVYLTLNSVSAQKYDEAKLVRRGNGNDIDDAGLKPGLIVRFLSHARQSVGDATADPRSGERGYDDARVDRMAATFVGANQPASQFVKPGPFIARWQGFIKVPLQQTVAFSTEGIGATKLFLNDKEISFKQPTSLNGGLNMIAIDYVSPERETAAQFRLIWESSEFAREPVPPTVLFHHSDDEALSKFAQLRRGRELFASLKCGACHQNNAANVAHELQTDSPNLAGVSRLNAAWMADWIVNPSKERPDVRMPHLNVSKAEAADIALWLESKATKAVGNTATSSAQAGSIAYEELGCIACHRLKSEGVDEHSRRSLAHAKDKFATGHLASFLQDPQRFHLTSRMPNFHLDDKTAASLAAYIASQTSTVKPDLLPGGLINNGAKLFVDRGCVQCHAVGDQPVRPRAEPVALVDLASAQGCLADVAHQRVGVPRFELALADRTALLKFLKTDLQSLQQSVPTEAAETLMRGLRCSACHDRDGSMSPRRAIIADESDRGLSPDTYPNLTWAGEKLHANWMAHFIGDSRRASFKPVSVINANDKKEDGVEINPTVQLRPWLKGRMPSFPAYGKTLAAGLAAEHGINSATDPVTSPDPKRAELGNALTQRTALDCRQCHAVGNQPAQGDDKTKIAPGINFALVKERVRYDYYQRFTLDPPRFDINTKMPKLAADGRKTKVTTILEGDAHQQFDAVWHFIGTAMFDKD
ncbi:MAG: ThuA domain-containing protein [Planctomycetia bacterium]|nr:ThuA domain-containing protein [Planctomycetia bacterium]